MELKNKIVSFLGDSITQGVGVADLENRYDNRLQKRFGFVRRNYGLSGTRLAYQSTPTLADPQFDLYFPGRAQPLPTDNDLIVVFGGTNDYGHGRAPFGNFEDRTPETYCGAIRYLIKILKPKTKKLVFMTPISRKECNTHPAYLSPDKKMFGEYIDAMIKICAEEGVDVFDLFRAGPDATVPEVCEKYFPDGLHPNDDGHEVIAKLLGDYLENLE